MQKSPPPLPLEQIRSWIFIWVVDLNVSFNFSDKNCLNNNNLINNNLVKSSYHKFKILFKFHLYFWQNSIQNPTRHHSGLPATKQQANMSAAISQGDPPRKARTSPEIFCRYMTAGIFRSLLISKSISSISRYPWINRRLWLLVSCLGGLNRII